MNTAGTPLGVARDDDRPQRPGTCILFCLPYAGGDSFAYWRWPDLTPDRVDVRTVDLPGRDGRPAGAGIGVGDVTDRIIAQAAGRPFALYGHSMGARLAFEVARELRHRGAPLPVRLYVGAAHPPHLPEPIARLARLDVDGFVDQLVLRAGTPAAVRDDPGVRAAVRPALATDLAWLQGYRFRPGPALPVPVVSFAGTDDAEVPEDLMLGWARHTSAGFRQYTMAGDHLFLRTAEPAVTAAIAADLGAGPDVPVVAPDEVHLWRVPQVSDTDAAVRRVTGRYRDGGRLPRAVSRSERTVVVALGPAVRGVDVEVLRPMTDVDDFCARHLSPAQRTEVLGEPEEHQLRAALGCWTGAQAARKAAAGAAGGRVAVRRLDLDGAVVAVATAGGPWRLRYEVLTRNGDG